jgi:hypothetical protein
MAGVLTLMALDCRTILALTGPRAYARDPAAGAW